VTDPDDIRHNRSSEELAMRVLCAAELRRLWPSARIIHELPTRYSENRIDLAAVTETDLVALEIKSSVDVADRLEAQIRAFLPIAHRIIVALAPRWNEQLPMRFETRKLSNGQTYTAGSPRYTEAQAAIQRVGAAQVCIWTVDARAGTVKCGAPTFRRGQPWARRMLDILHRSELVSVAEAHRIGAGPRTPHFDLATSCAELMTGREVERAVCAALRARAAFARESDPPLSAGAQVF
jgi:hypothetical protein